jgi:hypothetical protein
LGAGRIFISLLAGLCLFTEKYIRSFVDNTLLLLKKMLSEQIFSPTFSVCPRGVKRKDSAKSQQELLSEFIQFTREYNKYSQPLKNKQRDYLFDLAVKTFIYKLVEEQLEKTVSIIDCSLENSLRESSKLKNG